MIELFYEHPYTLRYVRSGPTGPYMDAFAKCVADTGFARDTGRGKLCGAAHLGHWMALECIDLGPPAPPAPAAPAISVDGIRTQGLLETGHFGLERIETARDVALEIVPPAAPLVWMVLAGAGRIETTGAPSVPLAPGTTVLLPAALEASTARLAAGTALLRVTVPGRLDGAMV